MNFYQYIYSAFELKMYENWKNMYFVKTLVHERNVITGASAKLSDIQGPINNYVEKTLPFFDIPPVWKVFIPRAWKKTDIF